MQHSIKLTLVPLLVLSLCMGLVGIALAEEASVDAEMRADASVKTIVPLRPLQFFHEKRLEIQQDFQNKMRMEFKADKEEMMEVRADMQMKLRGAEDGAERRTATEEMRLRQEEMKQRGMELRAGLKERLQLLMRGHLGSVVARLNAAIQRFESLAARMEARTLKLEERGINTASVEASLSAAIRLTGVVETDTQTLTSLIGRVTDESDPETVRAEIRAAAAKAIASAKAAHKALLETARELAALVKTSVEINSTTNIDINN